MTAIAKDQLPRNALKGRILKAGSWIVGGQLVSQVLRLGTSVVLTRLLAPDAFGLMSAVSVLTMALGLFSDLGIGRSIVQSKRGEDPAMLNTAWTIQVIRGYGLALGCLVLALGSALAIHFHLAKPGSVYGDSRLPWVMAAFALMPAIYAFDSIRMGIAQRAMRMHTLTRIDLFSQAMAAVAMICVALLTRSFWALVVGTVVASLVRCVTGHLVLDGHRERFQLDRAAVSELMGHAKWIFLSSILTFLGSNGDRLFLGGTIDSRAFGIYAIALSILNVLQGLASTLTNSVAYPALSEVHRERPHALASVVERFQIGYDLTVTFAAAALVVAGPALIGLLYDPRYREAGWMMSILAVGTIGLRYQIVEQCYQAVGTPKYMTFANFLRLVFLVIGLYVGQHVGAMRGAVVGIALSQFAAWPLAIWFKSRHGILTLRAEAALLPAIVVGLGAGWVVSLCIHLLFPHRFV